MWRRSSTLELLISFGAGVPGNHAAAVRSYAKAADQGNAEDEAQGVKSLRKCADPGYAQRLSTTSDKHNLGGGVAKDNARAVTRATCTRNLPSDQF